MFKSDFSPIVHLPVQQHVGNNNPDKSSLEKTTKANYFQVGPADQNAAKSSLKRYSHVFAEYFDYLKPGNHAHVKLALGIYEGVAADFYGKKLPLNQTVLIDNPFKGANNLRNKAFNSDLVLKDKLRTCLSSEEPAQLQFTQNDFNRLSNFLKTALGTLISNSVVKPGASDQLIKPSEQLKDASAIYDECVAKFNGLTTTAKYLGANLTAIISMAEQLPLVVESTPASIKQDNAFLQAYKDYQQQSQAMFRLAEIFSLTKTLPVIDETILTKLDKKVDQIRERRKNNIALSELLLSSVCANNVASLGKLRQAVSASELGYQLTQPEIVAFSSNLPVSAHLSNMLNSASPLTLKGLLNILADEHGYEQWPAEAQNSVLRQAQIADNQLNDQDAELVNKLINAPVATLNRIHEELHAIITNGAMDSYLLKQLKLDFSQVRQQIKNLANKSNVLHDKGLNDNLRMSESRVVNLILEITDLARAKYVDQSQIKTLLKTSSAVAVELNKIAEKLMDPVNGTGASLRTVSVLAGNVPKNAYHIRHHQKVNYMLQGNDSAVNLEWNDPNNPEPFKGSYLYQAVGLSSINQKEGSNAGVAVGKDVTEFLANKGLAGENITNYLRQAKRLNPEWLANKVQLGHIDAAANYLASILLNDSESSINAAREKPKKNTPLKRDKVAADVSKVETQLIASCGIKIAGSTTKYKSGDLGLMFLEALDLATELVKNGGDVTQISELKLKSFSIYKPYVLWDAAGKVPYLGFIVGESESFQNPQQANILQHGNGMGIFDGLGAQSLAIKPGVLYFLSTYPNKNPASANTDIASGNGFKKRNIGYSNISVESSARPGIAMYELYTSLIAKGILPTGLALQLSGISYGGGPTGHSSEYISNKNPQQPFMVETVAAMGSLNKIASKIIDVIANTIATSKTEGVRIYRYNC